VGPGPSVSRRIHDGRPRRGVESLSMSARSPAGSGSDQRHGTQRPVTSTLAHDSPQNPSTPSATSPRGQDWSEFHTLGVCPRIRRVEATATIPPPGFGSSGSGSSPAVTATLPPPWVLAVVAVAVARLLLPQFPPWVLAVVAVAVVRAVLPESPFLGGCPRINSSRARTYAEPGATVSPFFPESEFHEPTLMPQVIERVKVNSRTGS
jgi:hypothetical protein